MTDAPKRKHRCMSCRWWSRHFDKRVKEADTGDCMFHGKTAGYRLGRAFIDGFDGPEMKGGETCEYHNADPSTREAFWNANAAIRRAGT